MTAAINLHVTPVGRGAPELPTRGPAFLTDPARGCATGKVNPDLFFSRREPDQREAIRVCLHRCPFLTDCDTYATGRQECHGVWGGKLRSSELPDPPDVDVRADLIDWALTGHPELFAEMDRTQQGAVVREGLRRGISINKMARRFDRRPLALRSLAGILAAVA